MAIDRRNVEAVRAAADAHVEPLSLLLLAAVGEARKAVPLAALEAALAARSEAGVLRATEPAVEALRSRLDGRAGRKAAGDRAGVVDVLQDALMAGAEAGELCVVPLPAAGSMTVEGQVDSARLAELRAAFTEAVSSIRATAPGLQNIAVSEFKVTADVLHSAQAKINGLYYGPRDMVAVSARNKQKLAARLRLGESEWVVDNSVRGTMRHEVGHHVYEKVLDDAGRKEWREVWQLFKRDRAGLLDPDSAFRRVSHYSATSRDEFFSETFAAWTHPDYGKAKTKLPDAVEKFLERKFGGRTSGHAGNTTVPRA